MLLEARDIHCGYDGQPVLNGVDLWVGKGEILCILGPNGSGKTTLFKAILGLLKVDRGEICFNNHSILKMPRQQLARIIGYVPQSHNPPFPYNVMDVILMGRTSYIGTFSAPKAADYAVAEQVVETLRMEHLSQKIYTQLSGGERQLVMIARALAQQPQILMMDEPTSNLDYGNQLMIFDHIQMLAATGLAVIMISHMPDHALLYSDRVVLLKDGHVCGIGPPEEVVTEDKLKLLYGIQTLITSVVLTNGQVVKICVPDHYQKARGRFSLINENGRSRAQVNGQATKI
ncbi:MAG: ABC transporter ATP-binding protein [Syntrophomonadaceae bacterium]|nr:ABC transporter ATP-binding protein [Syntrophomonadaceae bacterium]